MIRIDLGADDSKKSGGNPLRRLIGKLRKSLARANAGGKLQVGSPALAGGGAGGKGTARTAALMDGVSQAGRRVALAVGNLGGLVLIVVAGIGAYVPHLVVENIKEAAVASHQARMKELDDKMAGISKEIARLAPFQKELEGYEAQKKLVKERLDVIRALLASRGTPVNVLDTLSQSLPSRVWLQNIDLDMKTARPVLNVNGLSFSNEEISDYVDKLSDSVYLQEVNLEQVAESKAQNIDVKSFQLQIIPKSTRLPAALVEAPSNPAPAKAVPVRPAPPNPVSALKQAAQPPRVE